jgi:hypothetical protein
MGGQRFPELCTDKSRWRRGSTKAMELSSLLINTAAAAFFAFDVQLDFFAAAVSHFAIAIGNQHR